MVVVTVCVVVSVVVCGSPAVVLTVMFMLLEVPFAKASASS